MSDMYGPVIVVLLMAVVLGVVFGLDAKSRTEREAEKQICRELAAEVSQGAMTRIAYMTTRCRAEYLLDIKE